jgi:hypothetical protein
LCSNPYKTATIPFTRKRYVRTEGTNSLRKAIQLPSEVGYLSLTTGKEEAVVYGNEQTLKSLLDLQRHAVEIKTKDVALGIQ